MKSIASTLRERQDDKISHSELENLGEGEDFEEFIVNLIMVGALEVENFGQEQEYYSLNEDKLDEYF